MNFSPLKKSLGLMVAATTVSSQANVSPGQMSANLAFVPVSRINQHKTKTLSDSNSLRSVDLVNIKTSGLSLAKKQPEFSTDPTGHPSDSKFAKQNYFEVLEAIKNNDIPGLDKIIAKYGHVNTPVIKYDGFSIDMQMPFKSSYLQLAAQEGKKEVVDFLLKKGANPNKRFGLPGIPFVLQDPILMEVSSDADTCEHIANALIKYGANINAQDMGGDTLLHRMAYHFRDENDAKELDWALANNADINKRDWSGKTPLMCASSIEGVRQFALRGAKLDATDFHGDTILIMALRAGNDQEAQGLIEMNADVKKKTLGLKTTLMLAAEQNMLPTLKILLDKGVGINAKDVGHNTALIYACMNGHSDCANFLIEQGAKIDVHSFRTHKTALDFAKENGMSSTIKLLNQLGPR